MSLFSSINGYMTNEQISENWCKYLRQQVLWGTWQNTFVALWLSQQGQGCFVWSFLKRCFEETVGKKKVKIKPPTWRAELTCTPCFTHKDKGGAAFFSHYIFHYIVIIIYFSTDVLYILSAGHFQLKCFTVPWE